MVLLLERCLNCVGLAAALLTLLSVCSFSQALMSLFVLASKDGWVNIMYHGLDAVAVDQQVRPLPQTATHAAFPRVYNQKYLTSTTLFRSRGVC